MIDITAHHLVVFREAHFEAFAVGAPRNEGVVVEAVAFTERLSLDLACRVEKVAAIAVTLDVPYFNVATSCLGEIWCLRFGLGLGRDRRRGLVAVDGNALSAVERHSPVVHLGDGDDVGGFWRIPVNLIANRQRHLDAATLLGGGGAHRGAGARLPALLQPQVAVMCYQGRLRIEAMRTCVEAVAVVITLLAPGKFGKFEHALFGCCRGRNVYLRC